MEFSKETGWKATRASGILALLLSEHPDMSWPEIYAWCKANENTSTTDGEYGLDDWSPSVSPSDRSALVGTAGYIMIPVDYPLPSNWPSLFSAWSAGQKIAELPEIPVPGSELDAVVTAATATIAPIQTATTMQPNTDAVQAVAVQDVAAAVPVAMDTVRPEQIAPPAMTPQQLPPAMVATPASDAVNQVGISAEAVIYSAILALIAL